MCLIRTISIPLPYIASYATRLFLQKKLLRLNTVGNLEVFEHCQMSNEPFVDEPFAVVIPVHYRTFAFGGLVYE